MKHLKKYNEMQYVNMNWTDRDKDDLYNALVTAFRLFDYFKDDEVLNSKILQDLNIGVFDSSEEIDEWFEEIGSNLGIENFNELTNILKKFNIELSSLQNKLTEVGEEDFETKEEVEEAIQNAINDGFKYYLPLNFDGYRLVLLSKEKIVDDFKDVTTSKELHQDMYE